VLVRAKAVAKAIAVSFMFMFLVVKEKNKPQYLLQCSSAFSTVGKILHCRKNQVSAGVKSSAVVEGGRSAPINVLMS
jgi:hypothetical protein